MRHLHLLFLFIIALLSSCTSGPDNDLIEEEIENHYLDKSDQAGIYYTIDDIDINQKEQDATNENRWTVETEISGTQDEPGKDEATDFTHTMRFELINKNGSWEIREIPDYLWKK